MARGAADRKLRKERTDQVVRPNPHVFAAGIKGMMVRLRSYVGGQKCRPKHF